MEKTFVSERVLDLGLIEEDHPARIVVRLERVEFESDHLTVDLTPAPKSMLRISFTGEVWSRRVGDRGERFGQCGHYLLDMIGEKGCPGLSRLVALWDRWHLNDTIPGTRKQMEIVRGAPGDYQAHRALLESHGLLTDRGYEYGTSWLVEKIPDSILAEIGELLGNPA